MTIVRIAHAEPRPGKLANGGFDTRGYLVVLADEARQRAVPVWLSGEAGEEDLAELVELAAQPGAELAAEVPEELTARLLRAAGASVTGVDIEMTGTDAVTLSPENAVARVGVNVPTGTRQVATTLSLGLAMAAAVDAPVRLADEVLSQVAVSVPDGDLLGPLLPHVPAAAQLPASSGRAVLRPRFEPRNLDFAGGLSRWDLDQGSRRETGRADYSAVTDGESAVLSSAVRQPQGAASLVQAIFADDYRGATVAFRGEIRAEPAAGQAGLRLEILRHWRPCEDYDAAAAGGQHHWSGYEITARIPEDALIIRFGVMLAGSGSVRLRNPELRIAESARG